MVILYLDNYIPQSVSGDLSNIPEVDSFSTNNELKDNFDGQPPTTVTDDGKQDLSAIEEPASTSDEGMRFRISARSNDI